MRLPPGIIQKNFLISHELNDRLKALRDRLNVNYESDVFRKGISVLEFLLDADRVVLEKAGQKDEVLKLVI